MDIEIRHERKRILREIDKLEGERCAKCKNTVSAMNTVHCQCDAAVEIRALGQALVATSTHTRQQRIDDAIDQAKQTGLTVELYRILRENEITKKDVKKFIGMTHQAFIAWQMDNGLMKRPEIRIKADPAGAAERRGLTVDKYLKAKDLGCSDAEIRKSYQIGACPLTEFKRKNGLILPHGQRGRKTKGPYKYDADMLELAKANEIPYKTFTQRVRLGWDQKRAATQELQDTGERVTV